jgi:hypothetical protein
MTMDMTNYENNLQDDYYSLAEDWSVDIAGNSIVGFVDTIDLAADTDKYIQLFNNQFVGTMTKRLEIKNIPKKGMVNSAEELLNRSIWIDNRGNVQNVLEMNSNHLNNILNFLSKKRVNLLVASHTKEFKKYKDGDLFFEEVIKQSLLWKTIEYCIEKKEVI